MQTLPPPLAPLGEFKQFVLYKLVPSKKEPGKLTKLPADPATGEVFLKGSNWQKRPEAWVDFGTASRAAEQFNCGVAFFFTEDDPFFCVDVDHCKLPAGGWSDTAKSLSETLRGAAIEISQSGNGWHIIGSYKSIEKHRSRDIHKLGLELYHEKRFIALTGNGAIGDAATDLTDALPPLIEQYFPPRAGGTFDGWTDTPVEGYTFEGNDDELIIKACGQKQGAAGFFSDDITFAQLWAGDADAIEAKWGEDRSKAEMSLVQRLLFWTGGNCARTLQLMWRSGLVRDKWHHHDTYLQITIESAAAMQTEYFSVATVDKAALEQHGACALRGSTPEQAAFADSIRSRIIADAPVEAAAKLAQQQSAKFWLDNQDKDAETLAAMITPIETAEAPRNIRTTAEAVSGYQLLTADMQLQFFAGCVYVVNEHAILTPDGRLLKTDRFNAVYGGYVFQLDETGNKTTRKAWEAFTESQVLRHPFADELCFRPDWPEGDVREVEGVIFVNTYTDIKTERATGDTSIFDEHMEKLFPNANDRKIVLSYMAACVQHKGQKFQWAPLIQGAPGNGKTTLSRCVEFAIGYRYTHWPKANEVDEKFNEWMFTNLFIAMEDVYYPEGKREIVETLKPMITNDRQPLRKMQAAQVMGFSCANFIFNSNYRDGIRKTKEDRRYSVFYTPQQTVEDLARDGMDDAYFQRLYSWLKNGGYAIVSNMLHAYVIEPEYNPALDSGGLSLRAPKTSSTEDAIIESEGSVEQHIREAIAEGRPGFANGWVSSMALGILLKDIRRDTAIPPRKRGELMKALGYNYHPGLSEGRVNNPTAVDGGKTRLYIKDGHPAAQLRDVPKIVSTYEAAQTNTAPNLKASQFFG